MRWFRNLATRSKLLLGFGLLIASLGVLVAVAYSTMSMMQQSYQRFYSVEFATAVDLLQVRSHINHQRAAVLEMMLSADKAALKVDAAEISARSKQIDDLVANATDLLGKTADTRILGQLAELDRLLGPYRKDRDEALAMVAEGRVTAAQELEAGAQAVRIEQIRNLVGDIVEGAQKNAAAAVAQTEVRLKETLRTFGLIAAIAVLIAILTVVTLNRLLVAPLGEVASIASRIAAGDLTVRVDATDRSDEIGALLQAFGRMTDTLKSQLSEIAEGVNVLFTATTEISSTTAQLAASTTETATSVAQTSATAQEVRQTAQVSTNKAQSLAETAQRAATASEEGRKHTADTVDAMGRIREQMDAIAETIVRLGEQSQTIGEIMGSVNDLAEQSNLLAVNAAIEAAKAGDEGKGFAVVAQEIKSLAEQSKQATVQVGTILNDVQKAISTAVMATDQGGKVVESGATKATRAGEVIEVLAGSVTEASNAAVQIAASSQQQTVGMDQMATALDNIRQASTQNADGTRQLEQSARNLAEQGQRLRQTVSTYRV